ncbi:NAD(P)-binding protein [Aspergillus bertholletiae]|uniref:NAD(P)-binding protein n=1 Tax=Aspergillus bertholletiae TaxID=1226010 RepID=A0A5N7ATW3_9EURO|nr:NAD(P)-binding protein [Aspergillus bertholletiae]
MSKKTPQPTDIDALLGPGPPAGLGKMQIMRWAAKNPPKDPQVSFAGKTVLVTGSNTGLGLEAALKFAAHNAQRVILAVRTPAKGEAAKKRIVAATGCPASSIEVRQLDMSNFASVRSFAQQLDAALPSGLDVALLNAGIAPPQYTVLPSGWEAGLQVNTLSTALLAVMLMPLLKRSALGPGQLTMTGSFAHLYVEAADVPTVDPAHHERVLARISAAQSFHVEKSYNVLKLLTMYIMHGLADEYCRNERGELEVTVNVACPGYCTTDLGRDFPWYISLPTKMMQMYCGRTAEEGSRSLVSATLLGQRGHGVFWTNDTFTTQGEFVTSDQGKKLQAQAWKEIHEICKTEMAK